MDLSPRPYRPSIDEQMSAASPKPFKFYEPTKINKDDSRYGLGISGSDDEDAYEQLTEARVSAGARLNAEMINLSRAMVQEVADATKNALFDENGKRNRVIKNSKHKSQREIVCAVCRQKLQKQSFSKNQWTKPRPTCFACIKKSNND